MNRQRICEVVGKRITSERNKTHGDPLVQLELATKLKQTLGDNPLWNNVEREAVSSILTKLSRASVGTPIADHWEDIIGYAAIAAEARSKE